MSNELRRQAAMRDALLERIVKALSADERVEGAWLSGSFGRDEEDEWSDFDLHVAIKDASFQDFLGDRAQLYSAVGDAILIQGEMASNSVQHVTGLHQQLTEMGIDVHPKMVPETARLILICRQIIENGRFPKGWYR